MRIYLLTPLLILGVVGEEQQCELLTEKFALEDLNTIIDTSHKQLVGTWLSEGCEIRAGPQYLLRSYTFRDDGTFKLIQHHYWDSSCSSPKLTITSLGLLRITRNNVYNPDAATGYVRTANMTLVPQDSDAAQELAKTASENCPDMEWQQWKKYEEYLLYDTTMEIQDFSYLRDKFKNILVDISCLGMLRWSFSELNLIKIQIRPIYNNVFDNVPPKSYRLELLLGTSHTESKKRDQHKFAAFHTPLLKSMQNHKILVHGKYYKIKNICGICSNLEKSNISPPHLLKKPELPPYIWGDWISVRCETKSIGFYLTRRFSFEQNIWIGEHKFYLDPFCTVPKFSVTTAGDFQLLEKNNLEPSATDIDLNIRKAILTIFDRKMSEEMSKSSTCNINLWEVDIPYELSHRRGCSDFNLLIPSTQNEIIKLDINYEGSSLLYLGLLETNDFSGITRSRPTSYQEALIKCVSGENSWKYSLLNEAYFNSLNFGNRIPSRLYMIVLILNIFGKIFVFVTK